MLGGISLPDPEPPEHQGWRPRPSAHGGAVSRGSTCRAVDVDPEEA